MPTLKHKFRQWTINLSKNLSRKGLYPFLETQFAIIPSHSSVLTIGAGGAINERLNHYAKDRGFDVLSFDIDEARLPDLVGDICTYDFGTQQFDVVVMSEVLEHVHTPHLALDTVYGCLKENGRFILTTPFIFPLHDRPYDYYRYTKYGLEHLLQRFSDVNIQERNSYFDAIDVLWVRLWREENKNARLLSYFAILGVYYVKRPFTHLLSTLVKTDGITTGYVTIAKKVKSER